MQDRNNPLQVGWINFCRAVVKVFYRRCEVDGLEYMPDSGPVLLCANHANALADALIIQTVTARLVHPLARSGLFRNWLMKPFMYVTQAVPVYRRQDHDGVTRANEDSFRRVYDYLDQGRIILIFPEGQSHSDPRLRPIKTGAARLSLGAVERGISLTVLPIGLNFTNKGKFRSNVFVSIGPALDLSTYTINQQPDAVHLLTDDLQAAIGAVTINVEQADDLDFLRSVERFFALRHGKYRKRDLSARFRALKKLNHAYDLLRQSSPDQLQQLKRRIRRFERLCRVWGIHAYQVTLQYTPMLITRFIIRSLAIVLLLLPVGLWGMINNYLPFISTRLLARAVSKGTDQYDTAKMSIALVLFPLFWAIQSYVLAAYIPASLIAAYVISLPPSAGAALFLHRERRRIWENLRVFFLFVRKRKLKRYMEDRRHELERELARLVRVARRVAP